ncbi:MBL fold metallo-hydrolase [Streptomyces sp. AM8-1-1]|uniref:MBL fold metallo-hydrolase n=1 Tax=Streptomyces sp. AM8-1-1 TaxID=3075825 RepID=UPI0028C45696|nr:MBL fold metallo-hydrolase [Streptomyces sp. AM8-1-1]WNO76632.1 MBL fold metallo-hydrolase [Streptomyces sp. AM8-1-1]
MSLSIDVFNSGYKPVPNPPGWTAPQQATWPATTASLISGSTDALLVDALITTAEGERLASWVRESGKNLTTVYITHGHLDHFFGAGPTLAAFPQAQLASLPEVVSQAQTSARSLESWRGWLGGQFDEKAAIPTALTSDELEIDGHVVRPLVLGRSDGVINSVVHVPDLATVVSGDVAYNNIHMWLWRSTPDTRTEWLATLDALAALRPERIITGHKDPDAPDDDARRVLDQSRRYIEDFDRAVAGSTSVPDLVGRMMEKYAAYGNLYTLIAAAASQFDD